MTGRLVAVLVAAVALAAAPDARAASYTTHGTCAGYPRVGLTVPAGWCVALLADAASGLTFPRRVLEVAPGRFWLVDMGSWEAGRGRLLEFSLARTGRTGPPPFKVLAERLDRPLGLAIGPDRRVYIGEAGRISRVEVGASGAPVHLQTVIDALPSTGAHPLKEIAFGS